MEIEADAQQIVSMQPRHDLGSRRGDQPERAGSSLAIAVGEAPPALACLARGDALAEYGVHRDGDRVGARR